MFTLNLPPIEKLTYLAITRYAGANNRAWPAYETLAADVLCSRRRVIDAVDLLQRCKLIEKRKRGNRTNAYLIYPADYYYADSETAAIIESRTRRGKGGRTPAAKENAEGGPAAKRGEETPAISGEGAAEKSAAEPEETGVNSVHPDGYLSSPTKIFMVNQMHPEGELGASPQCSEFTLGVNSVHPKNNMKSTSENLSLQEGENGLQVIYEREASVTALKEQAGEGAIAKKEFKTIKSGAPPPVEGQALPVEKEWARHESKDCGGPQNGSGKSSDFKTVKSAFSGKGYRAADRLINDLLRSYEASSIVAVIVKTDFNLARNPPAVIRWMLSTGSYVVPLTRDAQAPPPEIRAPDPAEDAAIREMIKNTKAGLLAKTLQKAL